MTPVDFEVLCRPLNLKYRALFGTMPSPTDYHGGRDIFLAALRRAVEEEMPLDAYLQRRDPDGRRREQCEDAPPSR